MRFRQHKYILCITIYFARIAMPKPVSFDGELSFANPTELYTFIMYLISDVPHEDDALLNTEPTTPNHRFSTNIDQEFRVSLGKFLYVMFFVPGGIQKLMLTFSDAVNSELIQAITNAMTIEEEAAVAERSKLLNGLIHDLASHPNFWQRRELLSILMDLGTKELQERLDREIVLR